MNAQPPDHWRESCGSWPGPEVRRARPLRRPGDSPASILSAIEDRLDSLEANVRDHEQALGRRGMLGGPAIPDEVKWDPDTCYLVSAFAPDGVTNGPHDWSPRPHDWSPPAEGTGAQTCDVCHVVRTPVGRPETPADAPEVHPPALGHAGAVLARADRLGAAVAWTRAGLASMARTEAARDRWARWYSQGMVARGDVHVPTYEATGATGATLLEILGGIPFGWYAGPPGTGDDYPEGTG